MFFLNIKDILMYFKYTPICLQIYIEQDKKKTIKIDRSSPPYLQLYPEHYGYPIFWVNFMALYKS